MRPHECALRRGAACPPAFFYMRRRRVADAREHCVVANLQQQIIDMLCDKNVEPGTFVHNTELTARGSDLFNCKKTLHACAIVSKRVMASDDYKALAKHCASKGEELRHLRPSACPLSRPNSRRAARFTVIPGQPARGAARRALCVARGPHRARASRDAPPTKDPALLTSSRTSNLTNTFPFLYNSPDL